MGEVPHAVVVSPPTTSNISTAISFLIVCLLEHEVIGRDGGVHHGQAQDGATKTQITDFLYIFSLIYQSEFFRATSTSGSMLNPRSPKVTSSADSLS